MSAKPYQVVGIGNALVDVLARTDEAFLEAQGIAKGTMQLIDRAQAASLYAAIGPAREISGGSVANSIAGLAQLGARAALIAKVRDDQLGAIFAHDLRAQGAVYATAPAPADHAAETGRCLVLVTPDGERSMSTYLGATEHLAPSDIDEAQVARAEWIFLEGYRFDGPESHAAFARAIGLARAAGGRVALTLSDPFCVERHRAAFARMLSGEVDLLFANRAELCAMYETADLDEALSRAGAGVEIVACTDGAAGVHLLAGGQRWHVPAVPTQVVDATGAGDLFAAGFLFGQVSGRDMETCGRMGALAASEIISHIGARPEADLKALFAQAGLL